MHRPLAVSPMLVLLARRAYASVLPRLGDSAENDPWLGMRDTVEALMESGASRVPARWVDKWPPASQQAFWAHRASPSWKQAGEPRLSLEVSDLVAVANGAKRVSTKDVLTKARFGIPDTEALPEVKVVGLPVAPLSGGWEAGDLERLEAAKEAGLEVWAEIDAQADTWAAWGQGHWEALHRLGVATWFHAPNQEGWPGYAAFLEKITGPWARAETTEQWAWPLCDLLQFSMEDVLLYGNPFRREAGPWPWEGRCRHPDWLRLRKGIWGAVQTALGGDGALEEILVASVLADRGVLVCSKKA